MNKHTGIAQTQTQSKSRFDCQDSNFEKCLLTQLETAKVQRCSSCSNNLMLCFVQTWYTVEYQLATEMIGSWYSVELFPFKAPLILT